MSETIAPPPLARVVVGLDPSLTGTAVCVFPVPSLPGEPIMSRSGSVPNGEIYNSVERRIRRVYRLADTVVARVPFGATVFIEGYSFASNDANASLLREYGGLLRWALIENGNEIVEVAPSSLKKFVCGSGGSAKNPVRKEHMMAHTQRRWGQMFATSDECDAYGLARLGLVYVGRAAAENDAQAEVVAKLKGGPVFKKPKRRKAVHDWLEIPMPRS